MKKDGESSSWEPIANWYDGIVGDDGHYYHKKVILPKLKKLMHFEAFSTPSVLDIGCGQGILSRILPTYVPYTGLDVSKSLIRSAEQKNRRKKTQFVQSDATDPYPLKNELFTHIVFLLSLQNIKDPKKAFMHASNALAENGRIILVLNHPCFRIPRSSNWHPMKEHQVQLRTVGRYLSNMEIPIQAQPSQGKDSITTPTYHYPLQDLFSAIATCGLSCSLIQEWCSDKVSVGGAAPMENCARQEIPLFMTLVLEKRNSSIEQPLEEKGTSCEKPVALFDPNPLPQPPPSVQHPPKYTRHSRKPLNPRKRPPLGTRPAGSRPQQRPGSRSHGPATKPSSARDEKRASWQQRQRPDSPRAHGRAQGSADQNTHGKKWTRPARKKGPARHRG